ncbi:hypothetical protein ECO9942_15925, partial [Escherichia coli O26:H11 str. CVM9942]
MKQRLNWLGEQRIFPQLIGSMTNMFEVRQIGMTPAPAERGMGKNLPPSVVALAVVTYRCWLSV